MKTFIGCGVAFGRKKLACAPNDTLVAVGDLDDENPSTGVAISDDDDKPLTNGRRTRGVAESVIAAAMRRQDSARGKLVFVRTAITDEVLMNQETGSGRPPGAVRHVQSVVDIHGG